MKCNKHKFPTEADAKRTISKAWSGQATWRGKQLPMRCYKCNDCNSWHLTSKPMRTPVELAQLARSRYQNTA